MTNNDNTFAALPYSSSLFLFSYLVFLLLLAGPYSNVGYKKMISRLMAYLNALSKDSLANLRSKNGTSGWYAMSKAEWDRLKTSPLANAVLNPEPEPVDISSAEQLRPLHEFLRSGQDIASRNPRQHAGVQELSFQRGTVCSDGRLDLCKQVGNLSHLSYVHLSI